MDLDKLRIDRTGRTTSRRRKSPWVRRLVVAGVLAVGVWLFWRPIGRFVDRIRLPEVSVVRVERTSVRELDAASGKAANGYVVAARRAALSSDAPGRIVKMNVREGSVVKKGDVVARLYYDEQAAAVKVAKADVAQAMDGVAKARADAQAAESALARLRSQQAAAEATVSSAAAQLDLKRVNLTRVKGLVEKGASTVSDLDDAKAAYEVAVADLKSAKESLAAAGSAVAGGKSQATSAELDVKIAKAKLAAAKGSLSQAEAALEKTYVRAPFDGVVVLKDAEVGEVVSPYTQGGAESRGAVVTMVDFSSLEVQANVPETSLDAVKLGAPAKIYLDAYPDHVYAGRVDRIWPTADRQKGTIEVRIVFLHPDHRLRPEMGVRVVFLKESAAERPGDAPKSPEILVPSGAITSSSSGSAVFRLTGDRVKLVPVRTGKRVGDREQILSGLEPGDRIVSDPPPGLSDGDRVRTK